AATRSETTMRSAPASMGPSSKDQVASPAAARTNSFKFCPAILARSRRFVGGYYTLGIPGLGRASGRPWKAHASLASALWSHSEPLCPPATALPFTLAPLNHYT